MADATQLKVVLGTHRVSYVHLKEPTSFEDGPKKYDVTFLIAKDSPDVDKIKAAMNAAYTANKESLFKGVPSKSPKMWNPLRDGDEWLDEHPDALEYTDCYFLKASSVSQPAVFDKDKNDVLDLDEVYSGCFCRGVIVCYPFNKNGKKGFGFFLNSVMKMDDGERIGGFTATADDYDDEPKGKSTGRKTNAKPSVDEDEDLL